MHHTSKLNTEIQPLNGPSMVQVVGNNHLRCMGACMSHKRPFTRL